MQPKLKDLALLELLIVSFLLLKNGCITHALGKESNEDDPDHMWIKHGVGPDDEQTTAKAEDGATVPGTKDDQDNDNCADRAPVTARDNKGCPKLTLLPKGLSVRNLPQEGGDFYVPKEEILFDCSEGYILSYEDAVVCQPDGTWAGHLPVCLRNWSEPKILEAPEKNRRKLEVTCTDSNRNVAAGAIIRTECSLNETEVLRSNFWYSNIKAGKYWTRAKKPWKIQDVRGHYVCYCRLQDRKVLHQITSLFEVPQLRFHKMPQDVKLLAFGQDILFRCAADGAVITWMWEDEVLYYDSDHHALLPDGSLLIMDIDMDQVGQYTCVAEHIKTKQKIRHSVRLDVQAPVNETCGRPTAKKGKIDRIFGGARALRASHPWIAQMVIGKDPQAALCSGNLVDYKYIVTAAHCVYDKVTNEEVDVGAIKVTLGKNMTFGNHPGELQVDVESIYLHPSYNPYNNDFDVAVLSLRNTVNFTDTIRTICLPGKGFLEGFYRSISRNEKVLGTVAGWGLARYKNGDSFIETHPWSLLDVRLPLVAQDQCLKSASALGKSAVVTANTFCAGAPGKDSCSGDSGGPFEMQKNDRTYLAGVISFGLDKNCGKDGQYGFYVKMENFVDAKGELDLVRFIAG